MTGCRFVGMTWCRFPYGWIRRSRESGNPETQSHGNLSEKPKPLRRHSRAGGNLGLSVRKLIG
ncbi:hypothetical protein F7O43_07225 [Neisseria meningitidis]|nr:hypothetical protein [Neisseria meningitidis]